MSKKTNLSQIGDCDEVSKKLRQYKSLCILQRNQKRDVWDIFKQEVLRPQYFYNIFTTNHKWLVVIGLNLNLTFKLLFCSNNNN